MSTTAREYKTDAVVLRGRLYGEADKILTLFTTERGKMDTIAKGARRTKSHLAGRLEITNEVALTMHRGRNLDVIVSADTTSANWQHIVQPDRFAAASLVLEFIDAFCEPDLALPDIYALLTGALRTIGRSNDPLALLPRFSMRLLQLLGLAPPVDACIRCGASFEGKSAWLDLEQAGFAGEECSVTWRDVLLLDSQDVENLHAIAAPPGGDVKPSMSATPAVSRAIEALVHYHLGRRPKAEVHALELSSSRPI